MNEDTLTRAVVPRDDEGAPLVLRLFRRTRVAGVMIAALVAWSLATHLLNIPRFLLPSPELVVARFFDQPGFVIQNVWITAVESTVGFTVAATLGIATAILISRSSLLDELLYPYVNMLRTVPSVAIAPLLVVWFGQTPWPRIIIATIISFFPIVVTTILGLRSVDPDLISLMSTLHARESQVFRKIRLPNALPYILASFRISAPLAVLGTIIAEEVGGTGGIGNVLVDSVGAVDTSLSFLMIVCAASLGIIAFGIVVAVEHRVIRWSPAI